MNKSGDISAETLIVVILLAIGFAVALIFYWQMAWSGTADKEACHESVVFRASLLNAVDAEKYVPLKCKTDKVCITAGFFGGSCDEFEGLKGVTTAKVKNIEQIEQLMAQNIVDCWTMMGEGKVSLFSQGFAQTYGVGSIYPSCVICTRVALDIDGLKKVGITTEQLAGMDIEKYMDSHLIPNKEITYNQFLVGESPAKVNIKDDLLRLSESTQPSSGAAASQESDLAVKIRDQTALVREWAAGQIASNEASLDDLKAQQNNIELQNNEMAILFMQISAPTYGKAALNVGKAAVGFTGSAYLTAPKTSWALSKQVGRLCIAGGWVGPAVCLGILAVGGIYQQSNIAYQRAKTAGYCGDVVVGENARNGCSVVRTVGYDMNDINQYCVAVESIS